MGKPPESDASWGHLELIIAKKTYDPRSGWPRVNDQACPACIIFLVLVFYAQNLRCIERLVAELGAVGCEARGGWRRRR